MHPVETKPGSEAARTEVPGGSIVAEESQSSGASDRPQFARLIGLRDDHSDSCVGTVSITTEPRHLQIFSNLHGGTTAALTNTVLFRTVRSVAGIWSHATTVEIKVNFFAPATEES